MYRFDEKRFINAGQNEFYRYGKKAQEKVRAYMEPNDKGFYSIPANGGKYWTIGTSRGKFGEFAKFGETFLSVNDAGFVWAKAGTEKGDTFVKLLNYLLKAMDKKNKERSIESEEEEE